MCHVATLTPHAKASDLLKWSVVLLATYSNNCLIIAYNERQLSINIGIFVFNVRGKIFTYPAKMKICVIIYFRKVTAWAIFFICLYPRDLSLFIYSVNIQGHEVELRQVVENKSIEYFSSSFMGD